MRTTPPPTSRGTWLTLGVLALVFMLLGSVWGPLGALTALLAFGLAAGAMRVRSARRWRRRARLLAPSFPREWREQLAARYDHYDRLSADLARRFEDDVRLFMAEKRITGVGIGVTDELRLLVAASAVTLSLGWSDYEWDQLTEVLLYPDDFDRDYEPGRRELAGQAHPWGTVILSVPALRESFADPDDAYHVGLHEFTHLLDVEHTEFDGIPTGLDDAESRQLVQLREREMTRMRHGRSVLDDYGAHNPIEFLPVAVEAFFEAALETRREHPELYAFLARYFRQDPAAWDDDRGLEI